MGRNLTPQPLSDTAFEALAKLAYDVSGLILVPEKSVMIQSRLRTRLRSLRLDSFDAYQEHVCSEAGVAERRYMISALTTNVSHFFREPHHYDILVDHIRQNKTKEIQSDRKLRIWSAGCSNGQEAVSIAISVLNAIPDALNWDFKILATDIDPNVVEFAQNSKYPDRLVGGVSEENLSKHFDVITENGELIFSPSSQIKDRIFFKELNLLHKWPMKNRFDAIFCRNVVIYFDNSTQQKLWPKFRDNIKDNGIFFLGHSERIASPETYGFASSGPTAYRATMTHKTKHTASPLEANNGIA